MSEVNTGGHEKGGKNKQKKQSLRVDFTPMVDMNMLLITFFMFCTSLSKPKTMEINMPSKDVVDDTEKNKVKNSNAVTIILGGDNKVYYYLGMLEKEQYDDPNFLVESNYSETGIRALLLERNTAVMNQVRDMKIKFLNKEMSEEDFKKLSAEAKAEGAKTTAPTVMIKSTDEASYKNLIDVLDEMQICNIGAYAIMELSDGDKYLMFMKTKNPVYAIDLPTK